MESELLGVSSRRKMLSIWAEFYIWSAPLKTEINLIYV